ncbi:MAG: acyltransferase family protein [Candidatus Methylumidiphilus sp.]
MPILDSFPVVAGKHCTQKPISHPMTAKPIEPSTPPATNAASAGHMAHPKYRADIDGLRAVAVISVVVFHAFPGLLRGGFIGVDIFFVISGFLISTIIVDNLKRDQFSFAEFYGRRVRRIFPALLLVLVASAVLGWFALLADEYQQLDKHIAGGAGFVSNLVLWGESGYFDSTAESKPLLHLWSLGIEEQFYIIWPLLLWAAWKTRINLLVTTIVIGLASFAWNIASVGDDTIATFYSPQTRFWELLVGAALACAAAHKSAAPKFGNAQSLIGATLIVSGIVLIDKERQFPGGWALLPTVGAALVIAAGAGAWVNRVVLANRVFVWFGLISFPLYLWHWPLLSFARILEAAPPTRGIRITAIAASIGLAWLTFRLIERPIRFGSRRQAKTLALLVLMTLIGTAGYYGYRQGGFAGTGYRDPARTEYSNYFRNSPPAYQYLKTHGIFEKYRSQCDFYDMEKLRAGQTTTIPRQSLDEACYKRDARYAKSVFLWGDSHAQQFYFGLKNHMPADWKILQVASSGCFPAINAEEPSSTNYCQQSNWFALKAIAEAKPDVVLIAQNADHDIASFKLISEKLKSLGVGKVIIIGPTPHWTANLSDIILRKLWPDTPNRTWVGVDDRVLKDNAKLQAYFTQTYPTGFVNLIDFFCNEQGCLTYLGDDKKTGITAWDSGHLTPMASDYLAEGLLVRAVTGQFH